MDVTWWKNSEQDEWRGQVRVGSGIDELFVATASASRWNSDSWIASVRVGDNEDHVELTLAAPKLHLHLACTFRPLWRLSRAVFTKGRLGYGSRSTGLHVHRDRLYLRIFASEGGSTRDPRFTWTAFLRGGRKLRRTFRPYGIGSGWPALEGWEFRFAPLDLLLGSKTRLAEDHEDPVDALICLPEGTYKATVAMSSVLWGRKRWRRGWYTDRYAEVVVDNGVPVPGKGENAWDCDDDAIYDSWGPARTPNEAIGKFVTSVLNARARNGHSGWTPTERA